MTRAEATKPKCIGPGCPEDAVRQGMCWSHMKQRQRNPEEELKPIKTEPKVAVTVRLTRLAFNALQSRAEAAGVATYAMAVQLLQKSVMGDPKGVRARK